MSFWNDLAHELSRFSINEVVRSFPKLFVAIDVIGCLPIIMALRAKRQSYSIPHATMYSGFMLLVYLFVGEWLLNLLGVDIYTFGVAGGLILFVMAVEMTFGLEIFKDDSTSSSSNATIIPIVFPLFAGASAFTTLLLLKGEGFAYINLVVTVLLNTLGIFLGLRFLEPIERFLGAGGAYVLRKFFGVILLAISVGFIVNSLTTIIQRVTEQEEPIICYDESATDSVASEPAPQQEL